MHLCLPICLTICLHVSIHLRFVCQYLSIYVLASRFASLSTAHVPSKNRDASTPETQMVMARLRIGRFEQTIAHAFQAKHSKCPAWQITLAHQHFGTGQQLCHTGITTNTQWTLEDSRDFRLFDGNLVNPNVLCKLATQPHLLGPDRQGRALARPGGDFASMPSLRRVHGLDSGSTGSTI